VVVGWAGDVAAERRQRSCAAKRRGARQRSQLAEILRVYLHGDARDLFVESRQALGSPVMMRIDTKFMVVLPETRSRVLRLVRGLCILMVPTCGTFEASHA